MTIQNDKTISRALLSAVIVTLLLIISGCASGRQAFSDPARTITVRAGKSFAILLESNKTTGYAWNLTPDFHKKAETSTCVVRLIESQYDVSDTKLTGAGGREIWRFQAVSPGAVSIPFEYNRPWERNVAPAKSATFLVHVE